MEKPFCYVFHRENHYYEKIKVRSRKNSKFSLAIFLKTVWVIDVILKILYIKSSGDDSPKGLKVKSLYGIVRTLPRA